MQATPIPDAPRHCDKGLCLIVLLYALLAMMAACISGDAEAPPTPVPTAGVSATAESPAASEADLQATVQVMVAATVAAVQLEPDLPTIIQAMPVATIAAVPPTSTPAPEPTATSVPTAIPETGLPATVVPPTTTPTETPYLLNPDGDTTTDRAALVALYNATNGPNWTNNSNWLSDAPLNQWHGVTTDISGRVTSLDINYNQLNGEIPSQLGHLVKLSHLSLNENQLSGEIPSELGGLSKLRHLSITGNQLNGSLPVEFGQLADLNNLYLNGNRLSGEISAELGSLANLQRIDFDTNQFTGQIPPELGSLSNLQFLSLGRNRLTGAIPAELGNLTNLDAIWLYGNRLMGCVPSELQYVHHNDFTSLNLPFCAPTAASKPVPGVWLHRPIFDGGIDLGVTYIERQPRFQRYKLAYLQGGDCPYPFDEFKGPVVCPEQDDVKRWPSAGETVELTAHVWNFGDTASGPFKYEWKINDTPHEVKYHGGLASGENVGFTLAMEWPTEEHNPTVAFAVDTLDEIDELIEDNNVVVDWIKGYTLGFYFSPEAYESLTLSNRPGRQIQSPEHWIHNNIAHLNKLLTDANLDDRVRAELFFITEDVHLDRNPNLRWYMDGMWKMWHQDPADPSSKSLFSLEGYKERPEIEYALLHELMHQLGVIDLYQMFIDTSVMLLPDANRPGQKAGCGTDYWPHDYKCFRLQAGIDDLMGSGSLVIGAHTAGALKANTGHRRGYFGEYLYDTPATVSVRIVDQDGLGLPNVGLKFYQYERQVGVHLLDAIPEFEVSTDDAGVAVLPNRGITGIVTATGHQLKPNPFGVIDVGGTNGTFVIEMQGPCTNYEWLTIVELNLAYWDGQKYHAVFTKTLRCPPP